MDARRFDDVAKRLASGLSRRRVLKGLAGGALASASARLAAGPAAARQCRETGQNCRSHAECCTDYCDDAFRCASAPPVESPVACASNATCPSGTVCCTTGLFAGLCSTFCPPSTAVACTSGGPCTPPTVCCATGPLQGLCSTFCPFPTGATACQFTGCPGGTFCCPSGTQFAGLCSPGSCSF